MEKIRALSSPVLSRPMGMVPDRLQPNPFRAAQSLPLAQDTVTFSAAMASQPQATALHPMPSVSFGGTGKVPLIGKWLEKISMRRKVSTLQPTVTKIVALEPEMAKLSDVQLMAKTAEFKERLAKKLNRPLASLDPLKAADALAMQAAMDEILPEAFAVAREVAKRQVKMRPFDVQMMAGVVLHQNKIAEMKTGEGKTLSAVMPVYLNALMGKGVHVVTANEYLAKRDAEEMGPVYRALGMSVGVIYSQQDNPSKKQAYNSDITYGTHSEFGFDYLRDHIGVMRAEDRVQRDFFYAIVDEADNILIDEAKTPLIISATSEMAMDSQAQYKKLAVVSQKMTAPDDYEIDYGKQQIKLTDEGIIKAEQLMGDPLAESEGGTLFALNQSLKAKEFFHLDKDYVIENGEIVIVDHFTGRRAYGRRWSQGLHMAIECKEELAGQKIKVQGETETDASITYQNFFRLYPKRSGMTGTAMTEQQEFQEVYGTPVVAIPTNRPYIQELSPDIMVPNQKDKFRMVADEIQKIHETGQPILVGTGSIADSEVLSQMLTAQKIPHEVLNAKQHEREAKIIADAGRLGAVTIATNMAGRGTDIKLGGSSGYFKQLMAVQEGIVAENQRHLDNNTEFLARTEPNKDTLIQQRIAGVKKNVQSRLPDYVFSPEEDANMVQLCTQEMDREIASAKRDVGNYQQKIAEAKAKIANCQTQMVDDDKNREANRQKIINLGGLYVIGMERNESRRIDNQLAGRCARQGDPGLVRFFVSTEDELFKINGETLPDWKNVTHSLSFLFGPSSDEAEGVDEVARIQKLRKQDGWFVKQFRKKLNHFQQKIEERNFEARKHLLKYDTVLDHYRRETYQSRDKLLTFQTSEAFQGYLKTQLEPTLKTVFQKILPLLKRFSQMKPEDAKAIQALVAANKPIPEDKLGAYQVFALVFQLAQFTQLPLETFGEAHKKKPEVLAKEYSELLAKRIGGLVDGLGGKMAPVLLRMILLRNKDHYWKTFLNDAERLRDTIQLDGYSGKDPLLSYQSQVPRNYDDITKQETWENLAQLMPLAALVQQQGKTLGPLLDQWLVDEQQLLHGTHEQLMNTLLHLGNLAQHATDHPNSKPLVDFYSRLPQLQGAQINEGEAVMVRMLFASRIPNLDANTPLSPGDFIVLQYYKGVAEMVLADPKMKALVGESAQGVLNCVIPYIEKFEADVQLKAPVTPDAPEKAQEAPPAIEAPVQPQVAVAPQQQPQHVTDPAQDETKPAVPGTKPVLEMKPAEAKPAPEVSVPPVKGKDEIKPGG